MSHTVAIPAKTIFQRLAEKARANPAGSFLLFWLVLNLGQGFFTELTSDEGYYWFYAQHLQWGYYDHPPMVAVLIKAGTRLLPGALGVRFANVVLSTAGLGLFLSLLPRQWKHSGRTYVVLLSAPLLHYLGFLVFPDGPLLFFSLVFLLVYQRFLERQSLRLSLLLGLSIALMAYSKYHGALVLLFTVLSNPRLLRSAYFYLALLAAALLFAPHLWWQYREGFPTLKYHLGGRTGQWSLRHVGEYLSQQILAIGPGLIFLPFVCRAATPFERALKFIIFGTLGFFLLSSFKTFVHFHWTSIALYPLLYFAVRYYHQPSGTQLYRWLILPFAVLFFMARLLLAAPLIPYMHAGEDYYHGRKAWARELAALAGNRPLFLPNNLREASLYSFYSGKQGVTLYNRPEKKSQYELWGYEDSLQGREVFFITSYPHSGSVKLRLLNKDFYYSLVPSFQSYYNRVAITATVDQNAADTLSATLQIKNETNREIAFAKSKANEWPRLLYSVEKNKAQVKADTLLALTPAENLKPGEMITKRVRIPVGEWKAGTYDIYFGLRSGVLPDAILSEGLPLMKK